MDAEKTTAATETVSVRLESNEAQEVYNHGYTDGLLRGYRSGVTDFLMAATVGILIAAFISGRFSKGE